MGISLSGLFCMVFLLIFHNQQTFAQTFANSQTNAVNGLCLGCGVTNPNNAVNGNVTDYSLFNITAGLLNVSVEQTLIFPSATTSNGCDSLFIGVGSANLPIDITLFQAVTVQTFNGATAHTPVTLSASILEIRILGGAPVVVARLKPSQNFDRVKVTLSSQLLGLLNAFRVYFAAHQSAGPVAPTVTPLSRTICSGQSTDFDATAPAGASFAWYTAASGGTAVGTGATFNTGALSSSTTFYAEANNGVCPSASRTSVTVTVNPTPSAPTVTPSSATICSGSSATLNSSVSGGSISWYTSSSGGAAVHTGDSFTTPVLSSTTTYYAEAKVGDCVSSRTSVTVTVNSTPPAPLVSPSGDTICSGQTATFTSSVSGGSINWYTSSSGGTAVHTGNSFTTPALSSTTTYYAEAKVGDCVSSRTPVTITVNPTPSAPTVTPSSATICSGNTTTLNSSVSGGSISWYTSSSGGTAVHTGNSFTTPALSSTTSYYAEAKVGDCVSSRTSVTVTVNPTPSAPTVTPSSATICSGRTATLNSSVSGGSISWYTSSSGGTAVHTGNSFTTPALSSTTTYYAEAKVGDCVSSRTSVTITVNPTPVAPTVTPADTTICSGTTATFNVTSPAGTVRWYLVASGGVSLYTGTPYTTPVLTSSVSFYVDVTQGSCTGPRTRVPITVISCP